MSVSSIFGTMGRVFATLPKGNAEAAAAKVAQVQSGLVAAEAVVAALPESGARRAALAALQEAAAVAGKAIAVAHVAQALEALEALEAVGSAETIKSAE